MNGSERGGALAAAIKKLFIENHNLTTFEEETQCSRFHSIMKRAETLGT